MRDHDDGYAFPVEIFDQFVQFRGHLRVQSGYRLIQQDDLARRAERPCKQDTLLLTAGKIAVTAVLQIFNCHAAHRFPRKLLFFFSVECPPAKPGLAAGNHSGVPTTGGVLSTHIGIPDHTELAQVTDLAHITLPSFVSTLTDSGYTTHYMSAADPAWDNLGAWIAKWYTAQHYNREREDDSTFMDHAIEYVRDTLSKSGKPFLATLMTRSNHYPFNFAAGMTDEEKARPLQERINVTMNYADRQLARFIRTVQNEEWYQNTYVIVMADHGFPLGENGVSTMSGGGFSNVSWIPFFIHGKGLEAAYDTTTAAQIDIAPTILELAGFAVPNIFMGHNLLRGNGKGLSLGVCYSYAAIGLNGFRFIEKYPTQDETHLFAENDLRQENEITGKHKNEEILFSTILDTLLKISNYSLEKGL